MTTTSVRMVTSTALRLLVRGAQWCSAFSVLLVRQARQALRALLALLDRRAPQGLLALLELLVPPERLARMALSGGPARVSRPVDSASTETSMFVQTAMFTDPRLLDHGVL